MPESEAAYKGHQISRKLEKSKIELQKQERFVI